MPILTALLCFMTPINDYFQNQTIRPNFLLLDYSFFQMANKNSYSNEPRPRLCHLRRWPDFFGYGFNLHCERAKPGQYIGKVDPNSPAESAGLRENDRIVEVNFAPVGTENHKQVVARIKEGVTRDGTKYPEEVILLVVDQDTDDYYKSKSRVIQSSDPNVEKLETESRDRHSG